MDELTSILTTLLSIFASSSDYFLCWIGLKFSNVSLVRYVSKQWSR